MSKEAPKLKMEIALHFLFIGHQLVELCAQYLYLLIFSSRLHRVQFRLRLSVSDSGFPVLLYKNGLFRHLLYSIQQIHIHRHLHKLPYIC